MKSKYYAADRRDGASSSRGDPVLIGTFASVVTLTSVMWLIQTGRLAFP